MAQKPLPPKTAPTSKKEAPKPPAAHPAPPAAKAQTPATRQAAGVVSSNLAATMMEDAGAGTESMTAQDLAIPRLTILQSNSPQVTKGHEKFIKGAETGDICETISGECFNGEEGIILIPVSYRRAYIEWITKDNGGGFVKDHGNDSSILDKTTRDEKNRDILPNGNQIVTTAEYFVIIVSNKEEVAPREAVLSMSSTQLKKAKKWNTMISTLRVARPDGNGFFNPAMYYRSYCLKTVPESNEKGNWMGWVIEPAADTINLLNGEELYMHARRFREQVASGAVRVAPPDEDLPHGGDIIDGEAM